MVLMKLYWLYHVGYIVNFIAYHKQLPLSRKKSLSIVAVSHVDLFSFGKEKATLDFIVDANQTKI